MVDDDPAVLQTLDRGLARAGYRPIPAAHEPDTRSATVRAVLDADAPSTSDGAAAHPRPGSALPARS